MRNKLVKQHGDEAAAAAEARQSLSSM